MESPLGLFIIYLFIGTKSRKPNEITFYVKKSYKYIVSIIWKWGIT